MEKINKCFRYLTIVVLTSIITMLVVVSYMHNIYSEKIAEISNNKGQEQIVISDSSKSNFPLLDNVYNIIQRIFYQEIDKEELETEAIKAILNALDDPYSYYMSPTETQNFNADVLGSFSGIGLQLFYNTEKNKIEVLTPLKDTPAYSANIKQGDYVIKVDGIPYLGEQLQEAINNIRGPEGTSVVLTIERDGTQFDVTIVRANINIQQLDYGMIGDDIGYIDIISFDEDISKDFENAYNDLLKKGIKGLIIDVRNNPGGVLSEVVNIADMLVPEGIIVYTVDKNDKRTNYESDSRHIKIPLVVLTNGSSASASEILAGAVKDHGVGIIVGTTTYGKGVVQQTFGIKTGGTIKLTTSEFFTPNGHAIDGKGVTPDVVVEIINPTADDLQLNKAVEILRQ